MPMKPAAPVTRMFFRGGTPRPVDSAGCLSLADMIKPIDPWFRSMLAAGAWLSPESHLRTAGTLPLRGNEGSEMLQSGVELQFLAGRFEAGRDGGGVMQVGGKAVVDLALQQLVGAALRLGAVKACEGA